MTSNSATIYIIDDDLSHLAAIDDLLKYEGFQTQAFSGPDEFLSAALNPVGVILLDMHLGEVKGLAVQAALKDKDVVLPVIFIAGFGSVPDVVTAMKYGAYDFLEKPLNNQTLIKKINAALDIARRTQNDGKPGNRFGNAIENLTEREREVFDFLVAGHTNKETASLLKIRARTVEFHRANIKEKLNVTTVSQLDALAKAN